MSSSAGSSDTAPPAARLGATTSAVRQHNLAALLERLHRRGPASRSELGADSRISRSTVADLVQELVSRGLVTEEGNAARSGPGRPSPVVRIRPEGAVVLAVELAVESVTVAAVGLGGTVLGRLQEELPASGRTPARTLARTARMVRALADAVPGGAVAGVGVAVPGLVRRSDGFVHLAPHLGWRDVPVATRLGDELDRLGGLMGRVLVANEADLGALGEHRRGAGQGHDNLVFVSGGVGIGAGLILDGRPMLGSAGYAGEAGHMLVNPAGRACSCGKVGCWETEAGEEALLGGGLSLEAATWLGVGVGNLVNLLNPDVVVLGGCYAPVFDELAAAVSEGVASRALRQGREVADIVPSALGRTAQLHGAAELCLAETLANPTVRRRA